MKTIAYKVVFADGYEKYEIVRVQARSINSGFAKALKKAREPLGNGFHRVIHSIEFWAVVS